MDTSENRLPLTATVCRAVDDVRWQLVVVIGVLFVRQDGLPGLVYLVPFVILYFIGALGWEVLNWIHFSYSFTDDGTISISSGVLQRRRRTVPIDQIENIRLRESLTSRLFGVTALYCETASVRDESEVEFRYISTQKAKRLRRRLTVGADYSQRQSEPVTRHLYTSSPTQLLTYSLFQIHLMPVIAAVGAVLTIAVLPFEDSASLSALLISWGRSVLPFGLGLSRWGVLLVLALCIGWAVGVVRTFVRMYDFRLYERDGELYRKYGLFDCTEEKTPIENVQIVRVGSNPPLRLFGYAELELQTAGSNDLMPFNFRTTVVPIAPREEIKSIVREVSTFEFGGERKVPSRARRRYAVRYFLFGCSIILLLTFAIVYNLPVPHLQPLEMTLLLPFTAVAAHVRWNSMAYAVGDEYLYIKTGFWRSREYIVPYECIQKCVTSQTIFQRRRSLTALRVETAAYPLSVGASLSDIESDTASKLNDLLS